MENIFFQYLYTKFYIIHDNNNKIEIKNNKLNKYNPTETRERCNLHKPNVKWS